MTVKTVVTKPATMPAATAKAAAAAKPVAKITAPTVKAVSTKPAAKPVAPKPAAPKVVAKPVITKPAAKAVAKRTPPLAAGAKPPVRPVAPSAAKSPVVAKPGKLADVPAKNIKPAKPAKARKAKLIRDSFTMPETEYSRIAVLKKRLLLRGRETKKSELLRAGLAMLAALDEGKLLAELNKLERIKTGRPPKAK